MIPFFKFTIIQTKANQNMNRAKTGRCLEMRISILVYKLSYVNLHADYFE